MKFQGGLPETLSGTGSTLEATVEIRHHLPKLLRRLGIKTLLDAPCGDLHWISRTDLSMLECYIGLDNDIDVVDRAGARFGDMLSMIKGRVKYGLADVLVDGAIEDCDAILCRDFLQHMPNNDVRTALLNIANSGARYALLTHHVSCRQNTSLANRGDFRPINLQLPPWSFPDTVDRIPDQRFNERILGAWTTQQIKKALS